MSKCASWFNGHRTLILQCLLVLFYGASLETLTVIEYLPAAKLFKLARFGCYALMALFLAACLLYDSKAKAFSFKRLFQWCKEHLLFFGVSLICLGSCIASRTIEPLVIVLVLACCSFIKEKTALKTVFCTMIVFLTLILALSAAGLLDNLTYESERGVRQSMGFIYPLEFASLAFFMILMGIALLKTGWLSSLILLAFAFGTWYLARSNFSMALSVLAVCGAFVIAKCSRFFEKLVSRKWLVILMAILLLAAFLLPHLTMFYDEGNSLWYKLNKLSHDRIWMGRNYYLLHTLHPFGRQNLWIGFGGTTDAESIYEAAIQYNYVDISYLKNVFDYGYIFGILEYATYLYILVRLSKEKKPVMFWVILMVLAAGMTEPRLVQIAVNPFLILAAPALMADNRSVMGLFSEKTKRRPA